MEISQRPGHPWAVTYVGAVMRRAPALLLLLALLGGLGATSAHQAQHALEWADAQERHADHHPHGDGDDARTPCTDNDAHALDCAVCSTLGGVAVGRSAVAPTVADAGRQLAATASHAAYRRAVAPARGPPAVA